MRNANGFGGSRWALAWGGALALVLGAAVATAQAGGEPDAELLSQVTPQEVDTPTEVFVKSATAAVNEEFLDDFDRLKQKAVRARFFYDEHSNPVHAFHDRGPEELYPDRYDEFEDWVEDNIADGLLSAIGNHPNTRDAIDTAVSVFNPGVASVAVEQRAPEYSALEEGAVELDEDARRTLKFVEAYGGAQWLLGPNHRALSRVKWLDYQDGIDDLVRWETRLENVALFGNESLSVDEIRTEVTYESVKARIRKANPWGLPFLTEAKVEVDDDDVEWGLVLTMERKAGYRRHTPQQLASTGLSPRTPLHWKLDMGVTSTGDDTFVGLLFAGSF